MIGVLNEDVGNEVLLNQVILIQGDNGELKSKVVKSYLMKSGIITRYTQPHFPEQNGMLERAFRTIYELAVSMLVHAGLPEPYWKFATEYAGFVSDITPNRTPDGYAREAYYKWYDSMFDYSKLRTFGSRAYVILHQVTDMGSKAEEGILVGFESNFRPTYTYKIYLPHKNVRVCSGNVNVCEHVGRTEPERLLTPIIELQREGETLDVEKYQHLVGTVHYDNKEGVQYLVVKVYSKGGIAQVDRVLYNTSDKDSSSRRHVDTVYLGDVITYPIILGKPNPRYTGGVVQYPRGGLQPGEKASAMELDTPTSDLHEPSKTDSASEGSHPEDKDSSAQ